MEENDFVSIWLEESGNPAIEEISKANHEAANKMSNFLLENGLNSTDLSAILDINHNEISSWLNNMHSFSIKKLKEMSDMLEAYSQT
jgi:predicted XRE-type DNA-binding protein